ncbi:hypothetical protein [Cognatilysobacter bugurensis]|uniref:Uncharacterized protein n=1 Tax=Cognatilysobacter bugurensis TaxID=543356 RepID=A0A918W7K9_9GAMM|nr:hypothetical protein [Lysobacter bugurensis]GHA77736.1 hypothetical protein GCM10007067_14070 [Lysobacter bugurensis]
MIRHCIRFGLLALMVLAFDAPAATPLGPLVLTPEERHALAVARLRSKEGEATAAAAEVYVPRWITLKGVTRRPGRGDLAWLGDTAVIDGQQWGPYRVQIRGARVFLLADDGHVMQLSVGTAFEPRLREVQTAPGVQVRRRR